MMPPVRVLLVDDHGLVRAGLRALAQNLDNVEVVAEATNGREALARVATDRPDIVLMDISMSGLNGLEATARITKDFPQVRVIILSAHSNEEYVCQALRAGAVGYLLKDSGTQELDLAIKAATRGETYLSPSMKEHVGNYMRRVGGEAGALDLLTRRQREILQLIAEGQSTKEIAGTLHISIKTVETHRVQLMDRLNIHDVAGLVKLAIRVGLVQADER
jgi:DNA-binding NarL/FixJ family response regulator